MTSRAQLHAELIDFLPQHCTVRDQRLAGLDGGGAAAERDGLFRPLEDASTSQQPSVFDCQRVETECAVGSARQGTSQGTAQVVCGVSDGKSPPPPHQS